MHISWARLASFFHLDPTSDPLIVSKFYNVTHDPKGQEQQIAMIYSIWYVLLQNGFQANIVFNDQSKEEGKNQESIQLSITPEPGHRMGKWQNTRKQRMQEIQVVSHFLTGDHTHTLKYVQRQIQITKKIYKETLPWNGQWENY